MADKHEFLWSILATDLDFAADGSLLVSDWVNGWDGEGKGRLYRFRDEAAGGGVAQEVKRLLTMPLEEMDDTALADLLSHVDRRVRQRAQFGLVGRGLVTSLEQAARSRNETVARHGIWGLWQKGLEGVNEAISVTATLHDLLLAEGNAPALSEESQAQVLRVAADLWTHHAIAELPSPVRQLMAGASRGRLVSDNLRLAGFAALSAGVFGEAGMAEDLLGFLDRLANADPVARHQAVMGLVHVAERHPTLLDTLASHPGSPGRLGVALAMGRLGNPAIGSMLTDVNPLIHQGLHDSQESIRLAAVEALAGRAPLAALPHFERLLGGDSFLGVQRALHLIQNQFQPRPARGNPAKKKLKTGSRADHTSPPSDGIQPQLVAMLAATFSRHAEGTLPEEAVLDLLEAAESSKNPLLLERLTAFREQQQALSQQGGQVVDLWSECVSGGNADRGRAIFFGGSASSCRRCHQVDGIGGNVGPQLSGIAAHKDRRYLLESVVAPNAVIAKGYDTVVVLTTEGVVLSGIVREETDSALTLVTPEGSLISIPTADIEDRSPGLSGMPADYPNYLSRREIRDLVAYLATLSAAPEEAHGNQAEDPAHP